MNEQMINIAYVSNYPHYKMGGQKSMIALIKELDRSKYLPHCFVPEEGDLSKLLLELDCKVHFVKIPPVKPKHYQGLPKLISIIRKVIKENDIKIIHPDSERDALIYGLASRLSKSKLIWHVRLTRKDPQDKILFRLADGVIGISNGVSKRFKDQKRFSEKYTTIFNGADLSNFYPSENKDLDRENLGLAKNKVNLLFAGQLKDGKGIKELLQAMVYLNQVEDKYRLYLAGKELNKEVLSSYYQMVDDLSLNGSVNFLGHTEKIADWMRACDILVLPSHEGVEGMGRVIFEAMACACVPAGSNISGVNEAVFDDAGILFEPKDPHSLAAAISRISSRNELLEALSKNAIKRAKENFDIKIHGKKVMEFYERILN